MGVEYRCLQALRKGTALTSVDRLLEVPQRLYDGFGLPESPAVEDLKAAMGRLTDVIGRLPVQDQLLAVVTWSITRKWGAAVLPTPSHDPGDDWLVRCEKAANDERLSWVDESSIRRQSDRVILEVLLMLLDSERSATLGSHEMESLKASEGARPNKSVASAFFSEPYVDNSARFRAALRSAVTVSLLGFSHNRMVVTYAEPLGRMLESGGSLRVLMLDPSSPVIFDANERSYAPKAKRDVKHQHQAAAATFAAIGSRARPGCFEVRLMDRLPPFTIYLFDENDPTLGQAFVWLTPWRRPSGERPGFHLQVVRDADWYAFFRQQVQGLWEHYGHAR